MTLNFFLPKNSNLYNSDTNISSDSFSQNIYLNIIDESLGINYSFRTPFKIDHDQWDVGKQRPHNIYLKKYKNINAKLNQLKIQIAKILEERNSQNKSLSQRILSQDIKKICSGQITNDLSKNTLLHFMELYIALKKDMISQPTYKRYMVFLRLIERFEGFIMKKLDIETMGMECIKDFILFGKMEEYSENTIYRTIYFIKTILNFAEKKGIRTQVRMMEIRREKQHKEIVTLSEDEIMEIKKTPVPEELQTAKDWLLISCYTGQRISDFMHFSDKHLKKISGKTCISFTQQKTGKKITLPLHPVVLNILIKNGGFPDKLPVTEYNYQIKRIAKSAGLKDQIYFARRSGHRARKMLLEKWEALSSHIGRRSFATNFYGKIPTPLLMEATGHTTERMFQKYVNSIDQDRVLSLSRYFDKMYEERFSQHL
jgi:site-specific recombinase XerD